MEKSHILFDLDGTIINPAEGIIQSIRYSLDQMGWEKPSKEYLESFIGPPLLDSYLQLGITPQEAERAVVSYREHYSNEGIYLMHAYEGIEEVLQTLSKTKNIYLATSKPDVFAIRILEHLGFSQYFKRRSRNQKCRR